MELAIHPAVFLKTQCATIMELAQPRSVGATLATVLEIRDATRRSATLRLMMFAMAMENVWSRNTEAMSVAVTRATLTTTRSVFQKLATLRKASALATGRAFSQPMGARHTVAAILRTRAKSAQSAHLRLFLLMERVLTSLA